jgi:hypothetical protein
MWIRHEVIARFSNLPRGLPPFLFCIWSFLLVVVASVLLGRGRSVQTLSIFLGIFSPRYEGSCCSIHKFFLCSLIKSKVGSCIFLLSMLFQGLWCMGLSTLYWIKLVSVVYAREFTIERCVNVSRCWCNCDCFVALLVGKLVEKYFGSASSLDFCCFLHFLYKMVSLLATFGLYLDSFCQLFIWISWIFFSRPS